MHRCTNVCVCFPRHFPPLAPPTLRGWEVVGRGGKGVGSARHAQVHDHAPIGIKGRSPDHEGGRLHGEPLLRSTPPGCHAELPPATQPRKCWKDHAPSRVVPERVSVRGSCVKLLEHQKPRTVCQHASKMKPQKHRGLGGLTAPKPRGAGAWALLPTRGQQSPRTPRSTGSRRSLAQSVTSLDCLHKTTACAFTPPVGRCSRRNAALEIAAGARGGARPKGPRPRRGKPEPDGELCAQEQHLHRRTSRRSPLHGRNTRRAPTRSGHTTHKPLALGSHLDL